jgi:hypothetical protein
MVSSLGRESRETTLRNARKKIEALATQVAEVKYHAEGHPGHRVHFFSAFFEKGSYRHGISFLQARSFKKPSNAFYFPF